MSLSGKQRFIADEPNTNTLPSENLCLTSVNTRDSTHIQRCGSETTLDFVPLFQPLQATQPVSTAKIAHTGR